MSRGARSLDRRCVALHEALTVDVAQGCRPRREPPRRWDAQAGQPRRVELVELHVLRAEPLRKMMPPPSPVSVWAFDVVLYMRPEPPVANTIDLAWKTWISPVASS